MNNSLSSDPPSAKVQNVKVEALSEFSLNVTWEAPPKSVYDGSMYIIKYKESNPNEDERFRYFHTLVINCDEEICSQELLYLDSFTEYSVAVVLHDSDPLANETVNQFTAEGQPDWIPGNVNCEAISSKELRLSWESIPAKSVHGIFKSYKIGFTHNLNAADEKWEYNTTMANETVLHGLKKNTEYALYLLASNSVGDGVKSEIFYCSTGEDGKIFVISIFLIKINGNYCGS